MARAPKKQPSVLEWEYTAQPGTGPLTEHLWYVDGPGIESNVSSDSKAAIETICAALNFATNFAKMRKVADVMALMVEQLQEFK